MLGVYLFIYLLTYSFIYLFPPRPPSVSQRWRRVQSDRRPTGFKLRRRAVMEDDRTSEGDQIVTAAEQKRDVPGEKPNNQKKLCPPGERAESSHVKHGLPGYPMDSQSSGKCCYNTDLVWLLNPSTPSLRSSAAVKRVQIIQGF